MKANKSRESFEEFKRTNVGYVACTYIQMNQDISCNGIPLRIQVVTGRYRRLLDIFEPNLPSILGNENLYYECDGFFQEIRIRPVSSLCF
jgi:hypothetical protein